MANKQNSEQLPARLNVDAVFNQIEDDKLLQWLQYELKHNKKVRLSFLTSHAAEITTTDIRNKYIRLCRKIKRKYGKNIDSHKKMTGSRMYKLFNELTDQANDQLSLENYLETYEITYAIHLNLFQEEEKDRLNQKGTDCLQNAYQLMNWLAESDLPPPLTKRIVEDWRAILDSDQYTVYDAEFNPYKLLFRVFEDEKYLLTILSEQLEEGKFSSSFYPTLEVFFNYAHLNDYPASSLNMCIKNVHATHFVKLLEKYKQKNRNGLIRYLIDKIEPRNEDRWDHALTQARVYLHSSTDNTEELWESIMSALEINVNEENLDYLVDFLEENEDFLGEEEKERLRKLEKEMPEKEQWYLLAKTNRHESLLERLTEYDSAIEVIPFLNLLYDDYETELIKHFKQDVDEHLQSHFGKSGLKYIKKLTSELRRAGYGNIVRKVHAFMGKNYASRKSIKKYLDENNY